jgi:uncharacterized membrane protein
MNDKFTDLADLVSEQMGKWYVSFIAFLLVTAWTIYCISTQGSGWWYGTFYNLPLNLVTTLAELWIGFLLAAAANRTEKRNRQLHDKLLQLTEKIEADEQEEMDLLKKNCDRKNTSNPPTS